MKPQDYAAAFNWRRAKLEKPVPVTEGNRLRNSRVSRKMSLREVARLSGIGVVTIGELERHVRRFTTTLRQALRDAFLKHDQEAAKEG